MAIEKKLCAAGYYYKTTFYFKRIQPKHSAPRQKVRGYIGSTTPVLFVQKFSKNGKSVWAESYELPKDFPAELVNEKEIYTEASADRSTISIFLGYEKKSSCLLNFAELKITAATGAFVEFNVPDKFGVDFTEEDLEEEQEAVHMRHRRKVLKKMKDSPEKHMRHMPYELKRCCTIGGILDPILIGEHKKLILFHQSKN